MSARIVTRPVKRQTPTRGFAALELLTVTVLLAAVIVFTAAGNEALTAANAGRAQTVALHQAGSALAEVRAADYRAAGDYALTLLPPADGFTVTLTVTELEPGLQLVTATAIRDTDVLANLSTYKTR